MNAYGRYMDTIRLAPEEHAALLAALEARSAPRRRGAPLPRLALCAGCLALLAGLWALSPAPAPERVAAPGGGPGSGLRRPGGDPGPQDHPRRPTPRRT